MALEALLFDVDGTLADTERDGHRVAFNRAFKAAGLPFVWDVPTYGTYLKVTGGKERLRAFLDEHPQLPQLSDEEISTIHRHKTEIYVAMMHDGAIPLRPGVRRLVLAAKGAGLILGIATTTTPDNVEALLTKNLGPEGPALFDYIGAGDIVPQKKPAPDIYLHVMERLGLGPDRCLALEDSENGFRAARAAGLRTIITCTDYTRDQDFTGAMRVLPHLGEPEEPATVLAGLGTGDKLVVDLPILRAWCA